MVQSLRDVVYIEFYDVIEEDNFDPKIKQDMSNLRLISYKTFEVRDLPFLRDGDTEEAIDYSVLMPIEVSKQVAEFTLRARFKTSVDPTHINDDLVPITGYMMTSRIIFSPEFAVSHPKALDKTNIYCRIINQDQDIAPQKTKLFFNKEVLSLFTTFIKTGDKVLIEFFVIDTTKEDDGEHKPCATYNFIVKRGRGKEKGYGLEQISG